MNTNDKLNDPDLPEKEQDALVGAFVRRQERERLRARWTEQLATQHDVRREAGGKEARIKRSPLRKIVFGVLAAAATVLFLVLAWPLLNPGTPGQDVLAALEVNDAPDNLRGGGNTTLDSLRRQLITDFSRSSLADAAATGERILLLPEARPADRLNLGLVYLHADRYAEAEAIFRDLLANEPRLLAEARYYLATSLLWQGETPEALSLLGQIQLTDGTDVYGKASDLLDADWD